MWANPLTRTSCVCDFFQTEWLGNLIFSTPSSWQQERYVGFLPIRGVDFRDFILFLVFVYS